MNMMKNVKILKSLSLLMLLVFSANIFASTEGGYFLSLGQKKQLMLHGAIKNVEGEWYNIWLSPGYVVAVRMSKDNIIKTKESLAEYFKKEKYQKLKKSSTDAFKWAYKDCLYEYTIKGTGTMWQNNFQKAQRSVKKRAFGWWLSYPWHFISSIVESAIRIPLGLSGTIIGTANGLVVTPLYYSLNSSVKAMTYFSIGTVFIPCTTAAFNTVVSFPMALLGQKPADSRVDGFWVTKMSDWEVEKMLRKK